MSKSEYDELCDEIQNLKQLHSNGDGTDAELLEIKKATNSCLGKISKIRRDKVIPEKNIQKCIEFAKEIRALQLNMTNRNKTKKSRGKNNVNENDVELNNTDQIMNHAVTMADENIDIVKEIARKVNEVNEIVDDTATKIAIDTEKINDINKELDILMSRTDKAKREVEWFTRQVSTDKCFIFLLALTIVGICILLFVRIQSSR